MMGNMQRTLLQAKLHNCTLTGANIDYVGSISIDQHLLEIAGILTYEQVQVVNRRAVDVPLPVRQLKESFVVEDQTRVSGAAECVKCEDRVIGFRNNR